MSETKADWIQTYTGRRFYPMAPREADVDIQDIAHALSNTCRFNGHVSEFYSVAQHSVYVGVNMWLATRDPRAMLAGLLHDAAEAYLCDVPRPVKATIPGYQEAEAALLDVIFKAFGLRHPEYYWQDIKRFDDAILIDEAKALMPVHVEDWTAELGAGLGREIKAREPKVARERFRNAYNFAVAKMDVTP